MQAVEDEEVHLEIIIKEAEGKEEKRKEKEGVRWSPRPKEVSLQTDITRAAMDVDKRRPTPTTTTTDSRYEP